MLDEQLRGPLWGAVHQHNKDGAYPIDVVRVGDLPDLPLGSLDPDILLWAEREGRVLVSADRATMPKHLADHLKAGHHSPGVFLIRPGFSLPPLVSALVLAAHAGDPAAIEDRIEFIP